MKAIAVQNYGGVENLVSIEVDKPSEPEGFDVLVKVKACSINPVDTKVRAGIYDDYPDYYDRAPSPPQIIGFDGSGIIETIGPDVKDLKPGDEVFYSGSPIRPGSNAEYQLVDSRSVSLKPKNLDFVQAAAMPLTWVTAWEALVERLGIQEGEQSGILIINGSGGVGSVASQIARGILRLPVVITTSSRPETTAFTKSMGATHTVNHREDIPSQIRALKLSAPIRYVFITHTPTSKYILDAAKILAPFGKVCSIVQDKEIPMYGTEWMAKSLTFVWCLLGTKPYYGVQLESHGEILKRLKGWVEVGRVKCHHTKTLPLNVEGVRKAHKEVEEGGVVGKIALGVDVEGVREAFV